jgi:hypothetical protein
MDVDNETVENNVDGVVKSLIYGVVAIFHALDIPYVWSRT